MPSAPGRLHWRQWGRLRVRVFNEQGYRCACGCGEIPAEIHHKNGRRDDNRDENLEGLTTACHLRRHDRLRDQPKAKAWRRLVRDLSE